MLRYLLAAQLSNIQFNARSLFDNPAMLRNNINRTACTLCNFEIPLCCNVADSGSSRYVSAYHDSIPTCAIRLKQQLNIHNNQHVFTFRIKPVTPTIAIPQNCLTEQRCKLFSSTSRSGHLGEFGIRILGGKFGERHAPTNYNVVPYIVAVYFCSSKYNRLN
jgi:hypothetical protein